MDEILINTTSPECETRFDYRGSKKKKVLGRELQAIKTVKQGFYQAEGRGEGLTVGDTLYLNLKGSKHLTLPLTIAELRYLIEPSDHWQATLTGEPFKALQIYTWQVVCDDCQQSFPLEFVSRHGDNDEEKAFHATTRLTTLQWQTQSEKHVCPECSNKNG